MKVNDSCEVSVHGEDYSLNFNATESLLYIELESKYEAKLWKNTFTADYIEELTKKTGNPKKYSVFTNILSSAIAKKSENVNIIIKKVFFEILTYDDLQNLKQQRINDSGSSIKKTQNNKRYLILSYQTEFEKVHYPLALNQEDSIDNSKLITKIEFLKSELLDYKSKTSEDFQSSRDIHTGDSQSRNEIDILKAKVKRLEESQTQKRGALEVDQLIKDNEQMQTMLQQSEIKIQKLEQTIQTKNQELIMNQAELTAFRKELTHCIGKQQVDERIKAHVQNMNIEEDSKLIAANKTITKLEKEVEGLNQMIDSLKKQDAVQKKRIGQLEMEIQSSMKKFDHRGVTDRLYSPYSNASNGSKKSNQSMPNNRNPSPTLSKNSRNSAQNQPIYKKPLTPSYNKPQPIKRPSPIPYDRQQQMKKNQYVQPQGSNKYKYLERPSPVRQQQTVNKSPVVRTNHYQIPQQQYKPRVNHSAQNTQKTRHQGMDFESKINNLKSLLQRAKN